MRTIAVIMTATALVLGLAIWGHVQLDSAVELLAGQLSSVRELIRSEQWGQARVTIELVEERWHEIRPVWSVFINDHHLQQLDIALSSVTHGIEEQSRIDALVSISELLLNLSYLEEMEQLSLTNIF